jgi:hypothetical protein
MNASLLIPAESESIGIVISEGSRPQPAPRFSAYLWEAPPEAESDSTTRAA